MVFARKINSAVLFANIQQLYTILNRQVAALFWSGVWGVRSLLVEVCDRMRLYITYIRL